MGFAWCSRSSARKTCAGLLKFLPPQTKTFMATVTRMSRSFGCSKARWSSARHRTADLRPRRRHRQSGRFGGARGLVPQRPEVNREAISGSTFFFGDCSFFFIDCFDRIVSQFLQLCQEYTSTASDGLSCLVKNRACRRAWRLPQTRPPLPLPRRFLPMCRRDQGLAWG